MYLSFTLVRTSGKPCLCLSVLKTKNSKMHDSKLRDSFAISRKAARLQKLSSNLVLHLNWLHPCKAWESSSILTLLWSCSMALRMAHLKASASLISGSTAKDLDIATYDNLPSLSLMIDPSIEWDGATVASQLIFINPWSTWLFLFTFFAILGSYNLEMALEIATDSHHYLLYVDFLVLKHHLVSHPP